jgi:hypothetical protein
MSGLRALLIRRLLLTSRLIDALVGMPIVTSNRAASNRHVCQRTGVCSWLRRRRRYRAGVTPATELAGVTKSVAHPGGADGNGVLVTPEHEIRSTFRSGRRQLRRYQS